MLQALPENLHPLIQFLYDTGSAVPEQRKNLTGPAYISNSTSWKFGSRLWWKPFQVPLSAELAGMLRMVSETVAMKISGHRTPSVFRRYNITSTEDLHIAKVKLVQYNSRSSAELTQVAVMR